jgi:hypothetical protein
MKNSLIYNVLVRMNLYFILSIVLSILLFIVFPSSIVAQKDDKLKNIEFENYENSQMFMNISVLTDAKILFNDDSLGVFRFSMYYPDIVDDDFRISISMDNNPKNETIEGEFAKYVDENSEILEEEETTLANFSAYKKVWKEDDEKLLKIVSLINGFKYDFTFETQTKDYKKYFPIAETMINSLVINMPQNLKYNWPVFIDQEKRFSIQYPFDTWTLKEKENRFEEYEVEFVHSDLSAITNMISDVRLAFIRVGIDDSFEINQNILTKYLDTWANTKFSSFQNFNILEPVTLKDYTINGKPAASGLYSMYLEGKKIILLVVSTITTTNNPMLVIYNATPNEFDDILPIVEKMIDSISIPAVD